MIQCLLQKFKNCYLNDREMEVKIVSRLSTELCKYVDYHCCELNVTFSLNLIYLSIWE